MEQMNILMAVKSVRQIVTKMKWREVDEFEEVEVQTQDWKTDLNVKMRNRSKSQSVHQNQGRVGRRMMIAW